MCGINKHSYFEIVTGKSEVKHEISCSENPPPSRRSFWPHSQNCEKWILASWCSSAWNSQPSTGQTFI